MNSYVRSAKRLRMDTLLTILIYTNLFALGCLCGDRFPVLAYPIKLLLLSSCLIGAILILCWYFQGYKILPAHFVAAIVLLTAGASFYSELTVNWYSYYFALFVFTAIGLVGAYRIHCLKVFNKES